MGDDIEGAPVTIDVGMPFDAEELIIAADWSNQLEPVMAEFRGVGELLAC